MLPFVHPVVGYVAYAVVVRLRGRGTPASLPAVVAVVAATLPDLIDQPLWLLGVTHVGRTYAHSLVVAVPVVGGAFLLARRRGREEVGIAFAVGYLSHVAADVPWHVVDGDYHELGFLLYPVTEMPQYTGTATLGTVGGVTVTTLWIEAVLFVGGIALWWRDGRPGFDLLGR